VTVNVTRELLERIIKVTCIPN